MGTTGKVRIADLMEQSGVGFGTSGARGLVTAMTDRVCYAYTAGFLRYLASCKKAAPGDRVAIARDLRPSSPRILHACALAARDQGFVPVHCGAIPTPAVTLWGLAQRIPSVMVTGSHIPDDRNGIKFNAPDGEILKDDEAGIREQAVELPDAFDAAGGLRVPFEPPEVDGAARAHYAARYLDFFPARCLSGLRVGVYEHSSAGRDLMVEVLSGLGAEVVRLGRSESFLPVDTEAVRPEDVELARRWASEHRLFAIVSTDGDADRPLVSDEKGAWLRGDVAGILAAKWLGADAVVTPVSSNTAVEKCGWFGSVVRTRIGSPFVIAAMQASKGKRVVGYEANGGFLVQSPVEKDGRRLAPLPTRDAMIVGLSLILLAKEQGGSLSAIQASLPARFTFSGRLEQFPAQTAKARIAELSGPEAIERLLGADFGEVAATDRTDGLRITFASGEIVHLRASGNAPELRCYNEAASPERVAAMNRRCLEILSGWR